LAGRRATDEFPGWIVRTHFLLQNARHLAAVRVGDPQDIRRFFAYNSLCSCLPSGASSSGNVRGRDFEVLEIETLPAIWYWFLLDKGNFIAESPLLYLPMTALW
jgi:hypothetical protein